MWNLFEHLDDPRKMLLNIKKILEPNGLVFVLVPNINGLVNTILEKMPWLLQIRTLTSLILKL